MKAVSDVVAEGLAADAGAFAALSVLMFNANAAGALTLTNQGNAEQFLANTTRNETLFDSTNFSAVRVVATLATASASINSPRLYPQYFFGSAWVTVGDGLVASGDALSLAAPLGAKATNWIALPAQAKVDNRRWRIAQHGGDGAADPALGPVMLQFR